MTKKTIILLGFIVLKFVLQYTLINPVFDLQRDEFLHLDQANHLAWGYLSIPPFTSWIARIILLLGNSIFWVKFFPALFGICTLIVVWQAIKTLGGNLFACILGSTCLLLSSLLRLNMLFQPNSFDVLSWTAFYFVCIKYFKTQHIKWLYAGAVVFALGFLNKYNVGFMIIGLLPAILISPHRKLFLQKHFYLATLLTLVLISPNIYWQYSYNFPVVRHMQELAATQLIHVDRLDFLKTQFMFFIGSIWLIIAALFALMFYKPFRPYRPLFWSIFFTLGLFVFFKAKSYYAIGLYPIYIGIGSVFIAHAVRHGWKRYLQPVLLFIPCLFFIPILRLSFPNKTPEAIAANNEEYKKYGMLRWEDGEDHDLPQDYADMLGWKALAQVVDSVAASVPYLKNTIVLCDNYGQAGAINFYTKNKAIRAQSFSADYINWLTIADSIQHVILVKEMDDSDSARTKEKPYFDSVYLAATRTYTFARESKIYVYLLQGAKIDVRAFLNKQKAKLLKDE